MSIRKQKRLVRILVALAIGVPLVWAASALWTQTVSWFRVTGVGIAAVSSILLILGALILVYLSNQKQTHPDRWEKETRKIFYYLILLIIIFMIVNLGFVALITWNIWHISTKVFDVLSVMLIITLTGLLATIEIFSLLIIVNIKD